MPRELYVYYRAAALNADALQVAVSAMHDHLRQSYPGLHARLLRRTDTAAGVDTWMETYTRPQGLNTGGVTDAMCAHIEQEAAASHHLRAGPRHTELFEPCA